MGKFQKGHSGGPGRPTRQTEAEYLAATMAACPLDTWKEIVDAAVKDAKAGDATARAWLGRYLVGDPSTKALAPMTVIIQQMTGDDPAMERAVSRLAHDLEWGDLGANPEVTKKARLILEGK